MQTYSACSYNTVYVRIQTVVNPKTQIKRRKHQQAVYRFNWVSIVIINVFTLLVVLVVVVDIPSLKIMYCFCSLKKVKAK